MKLSSLYLLVFTLALAACGSWRPQAASAPEQARQVNLPEFVDDPVHGLNEDIGAPRQKLIYKRN